MAEKMIPLFTHNQLVEIAYRWVLRNTSCSIAFKEFSSIGSPEQPDVIGFSSSNYSVLIECKISRSDFLCDKKKSFRVIPKYGMGRYRFYICPWGLITKGELPEKWGLIYVNENGKAIMQHNPYGKNEPYAKSKIFGIRGEGVPYAVKAEHALLYSALRRLFIRGVFPMIYEGLKGSTEINNLIDKNEHNNPANTGD